MDAQHYQVRMDHESRFYYSRLITGELRTCIAGKILSQYQERKKWKEGRRLQFDMDLYRDYLFDACRSAECERLIPEDARFEVALILGSDEKFYEELFTRSETL
ncbi:MAG: hypothetical protein V4628_07460 [Pseudomonadota bacterium]